MNNTKTIQNNNNSLYKLQENSTGFISNGFPIRRLVRSSFDSKLYSLIKFMFDYQFKSIYSI